MGDRERRETVREPTKDFESSLDPPDTSHVDLCDAPLGGDDTPESVYRSGETRTSDTDRFPRDPGSTAGHDTDRNCTFGGLVYSSRRKVRDGTRTTIE